ncbi:MAG: FAD-binding protein [Mogibacterium sp.]|nr:FAD-binding protein [Mogibacterium sp.]
MKKAVIIGSGIAGLSCAISLAEKGIKSVVASPFPPERSQSVMAAGGINAVELTGGPDSVEMHIQDTLAGGRYIAGRNAVTSLCKAAPSIVEQLERRGTVFTRDADGSVSRRAFGGQSYPRTCYCGASTGKQIVTALVMECRKYEALGLIERRTWTDFHSALIRDGVCCGALLFNESGFELYPEYADALVIAAGGQNALFGKTTGSMACDGYTAGKLFMQGAELKNLEFIQYHPTTMETPQKRMLISEAARGEGGRLFYEDNGRRVYFLEDKYGEKGNLMPRDIVSREIESAGRQVYLDVSFLGSDIIMDRIPEIYELCMKYRGIDITREPVPVSPSVHFFMGGLAVDLNHETNIRNLYAAGECASIYHGANRLGGNSLLAAIYGGQKAAESVAGRDSMDTHHSFDSYVQDETAKLMSDLGSESRFPVMYIRDMAAQNLKEDLGIVRDEKRLRKGIEDVDFYLDIADKINYDSSVMPYFNYSLTGILTLARAVLVSADARHESRGAHFRSDYPEENRELQAASVISYDNGAYRVRYDMEGRYEN